MIKQLIQKDMPNRFELIKRYLSVLFATNDIHVTKRELDILTVTAIRGSISTVGAKRLALTKFDISSSSLSNTISNLLRKKLLVKGEDGKTRIIEPLRLPYDNMDSINLNIKLWHDREDSE